jgi:hypothetical protein
MEDALLNLVNGVPIAAAVMYVWIVSEKNHTNEIAKWREAYEKKDQYLLVMQETVNKMVGEIQKLTFIIENYVVRNRKDYSGKQD